MFTGIVTALGSIRFVRDIAGSRRLTIAAPDFPVAVGDSIAVNGACLTAVAVADPGFEVEAVPETLRRTNLGMLSPGDEVNLERPMGAGGRFDGHIVQGHVDGLGIVEGAVSEGESLRCRISAAEVILRYLVEKGSVAIDGVSLTVTRVDDEGFEVVLIPHTLQATVLGKRIPGDAVNLEVDVLAKYVERLLGAPR